MNRIRQSKYVFYTLSNMEMALKAERKIKWGWTVAWPVECICYHVQGPE